MGEEPTADRRLDLLRPDAGAQADADATIREAVAAEVAAATHRERLKSRILYAAVFLALVVGLGGQFHQNNKTKKIAGATAISSKQNRQTLKSVITERGERRAAAAATDTHFCRDINKLKAAVRSSVRRSIKQARVLYPQLGFSPQLIAKLLAAAHVEEKVELKRFAADNCSKLPTAQGNPPGSATPPLPPGSETPRGTGTTGASGPAGPTEAPSL